MRERKPQCAGLIAGEFFDLQEFEAIAKRAAMLFDRTPQRRVGRVVDDHHAFEIRIIEPRHGIEGGFEHVRRLAAGRDMDRHFGRIALRHQRRGIGQPARRAAESDGRDLFHAGERNRDQRHQKEKAEAKREGRAGHEVMALPERDNGGSPGADDIGRDGKHQRLGECHACHGQKRQRQQQTERNGETGALEIVGIGDRSGPFELGLVRRVEQSPIGADAAFHGFPGLIDAFDDVVVDAIGLGAGDEIAQDLRLRHLAGIRIAEIIARARPAEFGDHDALAGKHFAQLVVGFNAAVDRVVGGGAIPIGQDVRGDEIDRRGKLGMIDPDAPDVGGRHRNRAGTFHPLDNADQLVDGHVGSHQRFVADDDGVDVAVVAGKVERGTDFALVAILVLIDPGADGDFQAKLGRDRRHQFGTPGRRIHANGAGIGRNRLEIGADLFRRRPLAGIGMRGVDEGGVRDACKLTVEIRSFLLRSQESPHPSMHARYKREHGGDGAHRLLPHGADDTGPNLPPGSMMVVRMRRPCERQNQASGA